MEIPIKNDGRFKKGQKLSEEVKAKLRIARVGKTPNKGKKFSEEWRRNMATSRTGLIRTEEQKQKLRGANHPRWTGDIPRLQVTGRYFNHRRKKLHARVVVEDILGRPLSRREIVHHINEDKSDDRPENLFLFRHQTAHAHWHAYIRRHKLGGDILQSNLSIYSMNV